MTSTSMLVLDALKIFFFSIDERPLLCFKILSKFQHILLVSGKYEVVLTIVAIFHQL